MTEVQWEQIVTLTCTECDGNFEVSAIIAEAMWKWEDESGDPIVCAFCSGVYEIYKPGDGPVPPVEDQKIEDI